MGTLREEKYKIVKNFLTPAEVDLSKKYMLIKHKVNQKEFDYQQNNNCDTRFYKDPLSEAFIINKKPLMEKETNLELIPTYSFTRVYTYNSDLPKHKDRPACEISVSVMIASDGTIWPFYMDGKELLLEPGDACIYLGCELIHERKPYTGDYHVQSFLHYVDKNGPYTEHKYDKGICLYNLD
jgi:hypothetical protein|tara:strand:- start:961 stop:1506 length:546 start_codon:yes stop_codon:yes gene_type:complete